MMEIPTVGHKCGALYKHERINYYEAKKKQKLFVARNESSRANRNSSFIFLFPRHQQHSSSKTILGGEEEFRVLRNRHRQQRETFLFGCRRR